MFHKNSLIALLIFNPFVQLVVAQKGFYLRPVIENKASRTLTYEKKTLSPTEYFVFEKQKLVWPHNFSPLDIGIYLGYKYKYASIELGIAQESPMTGFNLYFFEKQFQSYDSNYNSVSSGTLGIKIPIFFNYVLYATDSLKRYKNVGLSIQLLAGISQYRQPQGDVFKPLSSSGRDSIPISPGVLMSYERSMYSFNTKGLLYSIGLGFDLNRKKHNVFSINLYYQFGRMLSRYKQYFSGQHIKIKIDDSNKKQQLFYNYWIYSDVSGFVLQLSHKIHWSDFQKKEKEKQIRRFN